VDPRGRFRPCFGGPKAPRSHQVAWGDPPAALVPLGRGVWHTRPRATRRPCVWPALADVAAGLPAPGNNVGPAATPVLWAWAGLTAAQARRGTSGLAFWGPQPRATNCAGARPRMRRLRSQARAKCPSGVLCRCFICTELLLSHTCSARNRLDFLADHIDAVSVIFQALRRVEGRGQWVDGRG